MSGLTWTQTVWHSDCIPERIFWKNWFWKISRWQRQKSRKNFARGKELSNRKPVVWHWSYIGSAKQIFWAENCSDFLTYQLRLLKNHHIETVLLNTHNICLGQEIRKNIFKYKLISGGLHSIILYFVISHRGYGRSQSHSDGEGYLCDTISTKTLFYLISTLNASFPDYDFSNAKSDEFSKEPSAEVS